MALLSHTRQFFEKQSLRQLAIVYGGSLVNGASLFGLNVVLAHALSKPVFGMFSLSVFFLTTIAELSDLGLNAGLIRFAPHYIAQGETGKLAQLVATIWRWRVSLTGILTSVSVVGAYPIARYILGQPTLAPYIAFTALGIGGVILLGFVGTFLQASQRFGYYAVIQALKGGLRLMAALILMVMGVENLFAYLSIYIAVPWILFAVAYGVLPTGFRTSTVDTETKKQMSRQLANFSFWLTVASLASILTGKADQIIISHYLGLEDVAIFTIAWQLLQLFPLMYNALSAVMMPRASSIQNKEQLRVYVFRSARWLLVGVLGLAILIYPSQYLIHLIFRGAYDAAMPVYLVLAYGILLNILIVPFSLVITVYNRTTITAAMSFIQLFLTVAVTIVLIKEYGIMGVAYTFVASMVAQLIWNVSWALYLLKKHELRVV